MNFDEQVRVILKSQPKDKVEAFLQRCGEIQHNVLIRDIYYKPSDDPEIERLTKALKLMCELKSLELPVRPFIDPKVLNAGIEHAKFYIDLNKTLDTGGKPSSLSIADVHALRILKEIYNDVFGKSSKYTEGALLHQLGEVFIGKPISRGTQKLIDKAIEFWP